MVKIAPVGKLIEGHVLDVSKKPFLRALKDYDKQLYVKWNPNKLKGWGCWEIRRKPELSTPVYKGSYRGVKFYKYEYKEYQDIHHVLDSAFLNYDLLRKLKEMDTWRSDHWINDLEYHEQKVKEKIQSERKKELQYSVKQNRKAIRDMMEMVKSGIHPARILTSTKWVNKP